MYKKLLFLSLFLLGAIYCFSQNEKLLINISYQGSSTVGNFILDANTELSETKISIDTKPESSGGELAILEGRTDIAGIARLPNKEVLSSGVTSTLIGWDAIAIIVNKDNPIQNLTQNQLKDIYIGNIRNWNQLGGPDLEITPYIVGLESATRKVCRSIILGKDDYQVYEEIRPDVGIIDKVQNDIGGIGQISFSFVKDNDDVKSIQINGQKLNLTNKNYPITRPLYLLWWQGRRDVAAFIEWAVSNEGQKVVTRRFIGINEAVIEFEDEYGELIVYTNSSPIEDGGIYYYPHDEYEVLHQDQSLLMKVPNHLSHNDESPTVLKLPPGNYIIRTNLNRGKDLREFSVTISSGKLLRLYPERDESNFGEFDVGSKRANEFKSRVQTGDSEIFEFFGDFRVRMEQDLTNESNRFRGRFRIRTGMNARLNQNFKLGLRLVSTGDPNDPNSSHVNLNGGFNQIKVAFDRAFLHYRTKNKTSFEWWLGKFPNPNRSSKIYSEILWDADIQPEGTAVTFLKKIKNTDINMQFTNGLYLLSQFRTDTRKNWLYTGQMSVDWNINDNWNLIMATGLYYYKNIEGLNVNSNFIDENISNSFYSVTNIINGDTIVSNHYQSDFHIQETFVNVKTVLFNIPVVFKLQTISNFAHVLHTDGITTGIGIGELKKPKDWRLYYQFNYLPQDVVFSPYTQDDALQPTNTIGHIAGVSYRFQKKISLHLWTLINRPIDGHDFVSRYRVDLNIKF